MTGRRALTAQEAHKECPQGRRMGLRKYREHVGQRSSGSIFASPGCDRIMEEEEEGGGGAEDDRVEDLFGLITVGTVSVTLVAAVVVLAMLGVSYPMLVR